MADQPLASIIINNYNYGQFLGDAIDSALNQGYPNVEVIVVDDGSTDSSREIIARYDHRILPVLKTNGGQASAFNAGFNESRGEVVFFLDSDDILFPSAVEKVLKLFTSTNLTKVHWPLWVVDEAGSRTGATRPATLPPEGDFREQVLRGGPTSCTSAPTSGNAWARHFLEKVLPMPEDVSYYKTCADEYLYTLAPVFGSIKTIKEPQGFYRIHGKNIYSARPFREKLRLELEGHGQQTAALSKVLQKFGFLIDQDLWRRNSWFHLLVKAMEDVEAFIPQDNAFILVDDATLQAEEIYPDRKVIPFLEYDGYYGGSPENDQTGIRELSRLKDAGACFIVFAWPGFWWLKEYPQFHQYLRSHFPAVAENERVLIFDLRSTL